MPNIMLKACDGNPIPVDVEIACCSQFIKNKLDELGNPVGEDVVIPLDKVNQTVLEMVIAWMTHHKDSPTPPPEPVLEEEEERSDEVSSWDANFLKIDTGRIFELILAADYLDVKGLLDVTSKTVANMLIGKSVDDIRRRFKIKNDFTQEEEEMVRRENEWCQEK